MRSYLVCIHFTEQVHGAPREFTHELVAEAWGPEEAIQLALNYFTQLDRESWVGWTRTIGKVEVDPIPRSVRLRPELTVVRPEKKPETRA